MTDAPVPSDVPWPAAGARPRIVRATAMPGATPHSPVLIVGAGACGLTAALHLRDAGLECVLLEREPRAAGSSALSSGFVPAAGTRTQRRAGVHDDSPERHAADIQHKASDQAAAHLVQALTAAIGPAIDTLQQRHGIEFELLDTFLYPGHSAHRVHALPQRSGAALTAALEAATLAAGALLVTDAHVVELWCNEQGRVLGAGYARPDGRMEYLGCDVALLACNGFGGNPAMVSAWLPEMREAVFAGHVGNDGSAIAWGHALGARLADLGAYQGHGSWAVPHNVLITWALMTEGGIQVNRFGHRFHDETLGYSEASIQVLAQPGGIAWDVFDNRLLAFGFGFPDFAAANDAGAVRHAEDAAALARVIGCEADVLAATLTTTDLRPPYHAIKVTGALFHTQGGLDIDASCRVLVHDGTPLPNLLAAGGAARGVSGQAVWGYLSGNGLLSAIGGGAIAAATAAAMLQRPAT